ncbi:metallophosphoesterase [Sphingobacteriaceae bacterium]|nr:metallophosphoesterase [Sphingobacteriaceae bacterium]
MAKTWTRRKFIKAGFVTALGLIFLDSIWLEKFFIETNEFFLGNATKNSSNIKLIQVSDLHLTSLTHPLKKLAKKINVLKPDLILITGDAIDDGKSLYILNKFLKLLSHDIKKVAILGNWEYWGKVDLNELEYTYKENNCDLLINRNLPYEIRGKTLTITGVDDYLGGKPDIIGALDAFKQSDYHIVLNHCPEYTDVISEKTKNVDLILSGHTHGGQINLFGFVPFLPQGSGGYLKGWYKDEKKTMYVSKGIGTSILPVRFLARAEIAVFNLLS